MESGRIRFLSYVLWNGAEGFGFSGNSARRIFVVRDRENRPGLGFSVLPSISNLLSESSITKESSCFVIFPMRLQSS